MISNLKYISKINKKQCKHTIDRCIAIMKQIITGPAKIWSWTLAGWCECITLIMLICQHTRSGNFLTPHQNATLPFVFVVYEFNLHSRQTSSKIASCYLILEFSISCKHDLHSVAQPTTNFVNYCLRWHVIFRKYVHHLRSIINTLTMSCHTPSTFTCRYFHCITSHVSGHRSQENRSPYRKANDKVCLQSRPWYHYFSRTAPISYSIWNVSELFAEINDINVAQIRRSSESGVALDI